MPVCVWFPSSRLLLEMGLLLGFATLLPLPRYSSPALHSHLQTGCSWSSFPAGWILLPVRNPALTSGHELGILHAPPAGSKRGRLWAAPSWHAAVVLAHSSAFQLYFSLLRPDFVLGVLLWASLTGRISIDSCPVFSGAASPSGWSERKLEAPSLHSGGGRKGHPRPAGHQRASPVCPPSVEVIEGSRCVGCVPPALHVSSSSRLGAHLVDRRHVQWRDPHHCWTPL